MNISAPSFEFKPKLSGDSKYGYFAFRQRVISDIRYNPLNFRQKISANLPVDKIISYWNRLHFIPIITSTIFPYVYVVDSGNNRVQAFTYDGDFVFSFGEYGSGKCQFNNPYGIANDNSYLFVTDSGNNRVEVFDLLGNFKFSFGKFGNDIGEFNNPTGITVNGNFIIVADTNNNRVGVFLKDGLIPIKWFSYLAGKKLNKPTIVSSLEDGIVSIYDSGNNRDVILHLDTLERKAILSDILLPKITGSIVSRSLNINTSLSDSPIFNGHINITNILNINATIIQPIAHLLTGNSIVSALGIKYNSKLEVTHNNLVTITSRLFTPHIISVLKTGNYIRIDVDTPKLKADISLASGISSSMSLLLKLPTTSFTTVQGNGGHLAIKLPKVFLSIKSYHNVILALISKIPLFKGSLSLFETEDLLECAVVLHTSKNAVTEYSDFNFNSGILFNNNLVVASTDGLYMLDNPNVNAYIEFPVLDIRKNRYTIPTEFYINGSHSKMQLNYSINQHNNLILEVNSLYSDIEETRVKLPKGIKAKYVSFGLDNISKQKVEIGSIRVIGYSINRRKR